MLDSVALTGQGGEDVETADFIGDVNGGQTPLKVIVKLYDDLEEANFKIGELVEFVGVLSTAVMPTDSEESPWADDFSRSPSSVAIRMHAVIAQRRDPYSTHHYMDSLSASPVSIEAVPSTRRSLLGFIAGSLLIAWESMRRFLTVLFSLIAVVGDQRVAELVLLHLLARM